MKQFAKSILLLSLVSLTAKYVVAQKTYTVNVGNERLLVFCDSLNYKISKAKNFNEADESFLVPMGRKIDSIRNRAIERRKFIKELKAVNASTLPTRLKSLKYNALNARIKRENIPLADDIAYSNMLDRILNLTDKFRKNKKVYYASGKYEIPNNLKPKAKEIFSPVADALIRISNIYKEVPFEAVIKTTGYSDSGPVNKQGALYKEMSQRLKSNELTSEEINTYLSYLRSYDVSILLEELMADKSKYLIEPSHLNVTYDKVSLGAESQSQSSENIPERKRRTVYVYWHILPKL